MEKETRRVQLDVLEVFKQRAKHFALSGGTALELFYLHHRFSADLDFFSPVYDVSEIDDLVQSFKSSLGCDVKLEQELFAPGKARLRFYTVLFKKRDKVLKIDFIEDVIFDRPQIKRFEGIPVYSVKNIYLQKIYAATGIIPQLDEVGRVVFEGRKEARDVFDIYMLSKKIKPLHLLLKNLPPVLQRGVIHWYRSFSRQDLKLSLLDLDIYDKKFDSTQMIIHLENEIKKFIKEEFLK